MNNLFIFGGYVLTGGTFTDKNSGRVVPWQGGVALLAPVQDAKELPTLGKIAKFRRSDSLISKFSALSIGEPVTAFFDMDGRLVDISPLYATKK